MKCPICNASGVTAGHILGHSTSDAKARAARENAKRGGWPKGKKRKKSRKRRMHNTKLSHEEGGKDQR